MATLMMPIFGLASSIQDTVKRIAGMISGTSDRAKNKDLKGVSVRSLIHAKTMPMTKAMLADPTANATELPNTRNVSALQ